MLFLFFIFLLTIVFFKGFFKFVLPILIALFLFKLIFASFALLFNFNFLGLLLGAAFIFWLVRTVSSQKRNY